MRIGSPGSGWLAAGSWRRSSPACGPRVEVEDLPPARETLAAVGRRLGRSSRPGRADRGRGRGDRVLRLLTRAERDALGRDAIRFRVDRPVVVDVAAPTRSVPFWLADRGFVATGDRLRNEDGESPSTASRSPPG